MIPRRIFISNPQSYVKLFLFAIISIMNLPGCGKVTAVTATPPVGPRKPVQVVVWDDEKQVPLSGVRVTLTIPNNIFPFQVTDNRGLAVFDVWQDLLSLTAIIVIEKEGYQTQRYTLTLENAPVTTVYLVRANATPIPRETPTEIPTETPIPPTPKPDDTNTPVPTNTRTPINTPTVMATATQLLIPSASPSPIFLTRREGADTVYVVAGPDVSNVSLGTLGVNENAEVIGRTTQNEWFHVITNRGIEGWVANCEVTLLSTNLSGVPVTWTGLVTPKNCDDTGSSGGTGTSVGQVGDCVHVSLSHTDWPDREFDDVLLSWSNVPSTATRLKLWVNGPTNDGVSAYVVHPTFSDTNVAYKVEVFKFEDGDFKPGATYTYVVQPFNSAGSIICTTEGTFIP